MDMAGIQLIGPQSAFERGNGIGGLADFRFQASGSIAVLPHPLVSRRANLPDPSQPANSESSDVL